MVEGEIWDRLTSTTSQLQLRDGEMTRISPVPNGRIVNLGDLPELIPV